MEAVFEKAIVSVKGSKLAKWSLAVLILVPLVNWGLPPAMNGTARALVREDRLAKADVVIALGGDARSNRERRAAELYREGWAKKVVVSGMRIAWGIHTADVSTQFVRSLGVPASDVLAVRDATNTRAEAKALERLMLENKWQSAIVVTSAFHSRRATFTVERAAPGLQFFSSPVPAVAPEWQPERWWSRRYDMSITVREFISWANTLAGGWQ
jgi:uncharacterized SAM-binding protein YcdF (DUF218 family)